MAVHRLARPPATGAGSGSLPSAAAATASCVGNGGSPICADDGVAAFSSASNGTMRAAHSWAQR